MRMALIAGIFLLTSCNYKVAKKESLNQDLGNPVASISFLEVRQKIFEPKCFECHDFSSYSMVIPIVSTMRDYVSSGFMPKTGAINGPLSQVEKAFLLAWIDQGAPEFSVDPNLGGNNPAPTDPAPANPPNKRSPTEDHNHKNHQDRKDHHGHQELQDSIY